MGYLGRRRDNAIYHYHFSYLYSFDNIFRIMEHLLGRALLIIAVPFVLTTLYFGSKKGGYYDSDNYKGNGTAH